MRHLSETSCQLKIQIDEHINVWRSGSLGNCSFGDHFITSDHSSVEGSGTLLHNEKSHLKQLALEEFEIMRHSNNDDAVLLNRIVLETGRGQRLINGSINTLFQKSFSVLRL